MCGSALSARSQPKNNTGSGEHPEVVNGSLLVAGSDAPEALQLVHEPLRQMPPSIGGRVEPGSPLPLLSRDYSSDATSAEIASELSAAVSLASSYPIGTNPWPSSARSLDGARLHQGFKDSLFVPLSCGDQEGKSR